MPITRIGIGVTRISLGPLGNDFGGSVALPEGIELYCPQCGRACADRGLCKLQFRANYAKNQLNLAVECECGCFGHPPAIKNMKGE